MRDYHNQGILRLWQGLLGGLIIYLTIALISAIFIWAFIRYYNDAILTDYINFNILNIEDKRAALVETYDEATYQDLLQNIRETTAYHIALDEFIRKLLIGFISTFIISIVLRK